MSIVKGYEYPIIALRPDCTRAIVRAAYLPVAQRRGACAKGKDYLDMQHRDLPPPPPILHGVALSTLIITMIGIPWVLLLAPDHQTREPIGKPEQHQHCGLAGSDQE